MGTQRPKIWPLDNRNYDFWRKRKVMAVQPTRKSPLKRMPQKDRENTGNRRELKYMGPNTAY